MQIWTKKMVGRVNFQTVVWVALAKFNLIENFKAIIKNVFVQG